MELLTVRYNRDSKMLWHGIVDNYPDIKVSNCDSLELAQEHMYFLIVNEMWRYTHCLNSWMITTEIINYTPEYN
jgi:hypothetical protein